MQQAGTVRSYYVVIVNSQSGRAELHSRIASHPNDLATISGLACISPRKSIALSALRSYNRSHSVS